MTSFIFVYLLVALTVLHAPVSAQNPCDDAYGAHCPEEAGWKVGECLKNVPEELPKECSQFITIHDSCKEDIDQHCKGNEYTGDLLPCLTEWTNADLISQGCATTFPTKEDPEKKLSRAEKKKADKRRK